MQTSLTLPPPTPHPPPITHPHHLYHPPSTNPNPYSKARVRVNGIKGGGIFPSIGRAIEEEEEEYRRARAEVERKGVGGVDGFSIEGVSIGAHKTWSSSNKNPCSKGRVRIRVNGIKGGGIFPAIGRAIEEEEEYRRARAEVERKGVGGVDGFSIEGVSVGGLETCVVLPEFKAVFDIGRCPLRAVHQNFVFISHAHLDHIGGLPMYVATRELYSLKPPTIFVPPCIKDDVERLFDIHRSMGRVELNFDLVAINVGETYELRNDLVVRPFKTHHVVPSQGYIIYSIRKKLKKQYIHLKGKQIEKLKKSGVVITDMILSPEVAFTGDTTSDFIFEPRNADALRAKLLITEATFLDDVLSVEQARERGHMHLYELIEHAQWIRNKTLLLTHFSSRYHLEDIRLAVSKLQAKVSAKVVPLTEGFKSKHT